MQFLSLLLSSLLLWCYLSLWRSQLCPSKFYLIFALFLWSIEHTFHLYKLQQTTIKTNNALFWGKLSFEPFDCKLCPRFCHKFGKTLSQVWKDFVTCLERLCHMFGKTLSQVWKDFVTSLRLSQIWKDSVTNLEDCHKFGKTLPQVCKDFTTSLERLCHKFGKTLPQVWKDFAISVERLWTNWEALIWSKPFWL